MSLSISTAHKNATKCTVLTDTQRRGEVLEYAPHSTCTGVPRGSHVTSSPSSGEWEFAACSIQRLQACACSPALQPVTPQQLEDPYPTATEPWPVALTL